MASNFNRAEYEKAYRETHREEIRKYKKEYRETHREEIRDYARKWRSENPDKVKAYSKKYYYEHRDKIRIQKFDYWVSLNYNKIYGYERECGYEVNEYNSLTVLNAYNEYKMNCID